MATADSHLKNYFRSYSLRDMVISMISDDSKDMYGFRPRYNYAAMTLVELWNLHRSIRKESHYWVDESNAAFEYWEEVDRREAEQRNVMYDVAPDHWDHVADRLEGIRIS